MPGPVPLIALVSAFLTAAATILIRQGLRDGGTYTALWINLAVGTSGLWVVVAATGGVGELPLAGVGFFVLAGLVGTVAGRLFRFLAIDRVGASVTAALTNLYPLFATALAVLLLGERVTLPILAGTVVIVAGTTLLSLSGTALGFMPRHLLLPLVSAFCFGTVQILRKLGVGHVGPVTGAAINTTTALVVFTAFLVASGQRDLMRCRGRALALFVGAGLAENAGIFLLIVALSIGSVSVVTPLAGSAPIFVLALSPLFLRGIEVLTARVIAGTVLIVLGVYLVTALGGP
jgi:uncharacterized membrane protein